MSQAHHQWYPLVNIQKAIENGHRNSELSQLQNGGSFHSYVKLPVLFTTWHGSCQNPALGLLVHLGGWRNPQACSKLTLELAQHLSGGAVVTWDTDQGLKYSCPMLSLYIICISHVYVCICMYVYYITLFYIILHYITLYYIIFIFILYYIILYYINIILYYIILYYIHIHIHIHIYICLDKCICM